MKTTEIQLNPFEWVIAKLLGKLPRHLRINKVLRVTVTRFRPTDVSIKLDLKSSVGWVPIASVWVNGTLGTVQSDVHIYVHPSEIKRLMAKHPGVTTKYV